MADETASGLPYPELPDANNPPADFKALAEAIDAIYGKSVANVAALPATAAFKNQQIYVEDIDTIVYYDESTAAWEGYWKNFTPTWANTTLGTGVTNQARYMKRGKLLVVWFNFIFGAGGAFTGVPTMSTPLTLATSENLDIGVVRMLDASGPTRRHGSVQIFTSTTVGFELENATPIGVQTSGTAPWTWTVSDALRGTYTAELA